MGLTKAHLLADGVSCQRPDPVPDGQRVDSSGKGASSRVGRLVRTLVGASAAAVAAGPVGAVQGPNLDRLVSGAGDNEARRAHDVHGADLGSVAVPLGEHELTRVGVPSKQGSVPSA